MHFSAIMVTRTRRSNTMPTTKTKTSAMDLVGSMAGAKAPSKAKDAKPNLQDPDLEEAISAFATHKAAEETAKALKLAAQDQIVQRVRPFRLAECVRARKVLSSVTVNNRLTATQQSRYSTVPEDAVADLEAAFGDDADVYFEGLLSIGLAEGSANNEAVLQELIDKLGPEFFQEHFEVRRDRKVTTAFHDAYCTDAAVQETAQPFIDAGVIKPYSMSLRVK